MEHRGRWEAGIDMKIKIPDIFCYWWYTVKYFAQGDTLGEASRYAYYIVYGFKL